MAAVVGIVGGVAALKLGGIIRTDGNSSSGYRAVVPEAGGVAGILVQMQEKNVAAHVDRFIRPPIIRQFAHIAYPFDALPFDDTAGIENPGSVETCSAVVEHQPINRGVKFGTDE